MKRFARIVNGFQLKNKHTLNDESLKESQWKLKQQHD